MPRAAIVVDRAPRAAQDPGFQLRFQSVRSWLEADGFDVDVIVLTRGSDGSPSASLRARAAVFPPAGVKRLPESHEVVVVLALAAPHMILLARRLVRSERTVIDLCDSVVLTERGSVRRRDFRSWLKSRVSRLALTRLSTIRIAYISDRDAEADRSLNRSRRVTILPQSVPLGLSELEDYVGPPRRIVVPADFSAPHNRVAFRWFLEGVRSGELVLKVPVELYGPHAPDEELPPGISFRGWAPALPDVYRGETAVFAPNVEAAGIQNKLWEAVHAGRPVLVGARAAGTFAARYGVITFESQVDLAAKFEALQEFRAEAAIGRGAD